MGPATLSTWARVPPAIDPIDKTDAISRTRAGLSSLRRAGTRDKDATLGAILQAAAVVFSTQGLRAGRTEEIATLAGVAKGLIFHHFKSKEQLFEAVLQNAYAPLRELLGEETLHSGPPAEALASLVERLLAAMSASPLGPSIFLLESIQNHGEHYKKLGMPSIYRSLERVLRRGIRQGVFRQMDPGNVSIQIVGLCSFYYCAVNNFSEGTTADPLSPKALARHSREVLAFVQAGTQAR